MGLNSQNYAYTSAVSQCLFPQDLGMPPSQKVVPKGPTDTKGGIVGRRIEIHLSFLCKYKFFSPCTRGNLDRASNSEGNVLALIYLLSSSVRSQFCFIRWGLVPGKCASYRSPGYLNLSHFAFTAFAKNWLYEWYWNHLQYCKRREDCLSLVSLRIIPYSTSPKRRYVLHLVSPFLQVI